MKIIHHKWQKDLEYKGTYRDRFTCICGAERLTYYTTKYGLRPQKVYVYNKGIFTYSRVPKCTRVVDKPFPDIFTNPNNQLPL